MIRPRLLLVSLFAAALYGQVETARISGTVTDASGAVIPGASITIVHVATDAHATLATDHTGHFLSLPLRIGEYRVEASAAGFKHIVRSGIVLQIQETAVVDFRLEVGQTSERVEVTAAAPLLTTTEATQGQVIDNTRINEMPLNGRDYLQLALLSGGTMQATNGSNFGGFSAGGQRAAQNNYLLDGIDNNNVQLAAQGNQAEAVKPSIDAIQEFKISTNSFSAEYGRATGGVVNVTIKSGTNELHGTAFEFLRNDKLDAKNFFDPADEDKPPFKRNQFGFSLGGPVRKNKTFIFGDYEWTRIRESRTLNNTIPTLAQRSGNFNGVATIYDPATYNAQSKTRQPFAGNVIPADRIDPVAAKAAAWYPQPTSSAIKQNYLTNPPRQSDIDKWDVRIDHTFSQSDLVYVRFSRHEEFAPPSFTLPPPAYGNNSTSSYNNGVNGALVWNHIFSPTIVTSSRAGWNRLNSNLQSPVPSNVNREIGLKGVEQTLAGAPQFQINSYVTLGMQPNLPNLNDSQTRQLVSDTTIARSRHSIKFGINLSWLQSYISNPKQSLGQFTFNGQFSRNPASSSGGNAFADFLLGIPFNTTVARPVYANLRAPFYQAYVQDEWRVSTKLTLNIGVRYELNMPFVETRNGLSNFDTDLNPSNPQLILAKDGSRLDRALTATDANNLVPRFGFAYQASAKTVFRGGYGMFVGNYEGTGGGRHLLGNPPNTIAVTMKTDGVTPLYTLAGGVPNQLTPENVKDLRLSSFERDSKWPIGQQWNFNMQRQLSPTLMVEAGYYGAKAQHLPFRWNNNFVLPGPGNIAARRPYRSVIYPGTNVVVNSLTQTDRNDYLGNSLYHSFQARAERRFAGGFTILASYTWSHNIGDTAGFSASGNVPNDAGIQNPLNRRLERGNDDQDVRHRFVASYVYELPFGAARRFGSGWKGPVNVLLGGWSVSGITTMHSGLPLSLATQGNNANVDEPNRPDVAGDWRLDASERTLDRFFNTAAFAANRLYQYGNAGRNILRQPGSVNFDLGMFKQVEVTERLATQFRAEAFNAFNTPHFGAPDATVGSLSFGTITGAGSPRILQFGLKVVF